MNELEFQLIRKAVRGDHAAFEQLIVSHEKTIYNIAYRMFGNEQDAYDVAQDVLIKVYQNLEQFNFQSSFGTWLYRLATNTCIDAYRKQKRKTSHESSMDQSIETDESSIQREFEDPHLTPEQTYLQKEIVNEVQTAIQALSENHKTIIILRDIQGMSYQEIGEILSCNEGTVKSRLARARNSLKEIILRNREQLLKQVVK